MTAPHTTSTIGTGDLSTNPIGIGIPHASTAAPLDVVAAFDAAFVGRRCELVRADGRTVPLPVAQWSAEADAADRRLFLDRCLGPTLDIGCGPGRLTAALVARGVPAMGIDVSGVAVVSTQARGAAALRRDVFDEVPAAGRWEHALLADGNIGIGADPVRLLRRVGELVRRGGTVLVELARPGFGIHREEIRLRVGDRVSGAFGWAWVGADAIESLASAAGLTWQETTSYAGRRVAVLVAPPRPSFAPGGPVSGPPHRQQGRETVDANEARP